MSDIHGGCPAQALQSCAGIAMMPGIDIQETWSGFMPTCFSMNRALGSKPLPVNMPMGIVAALASALLLQLQLGLLVKPLDRAVTTGLEADKVRRLFERSAA